MFLLLRYCQRTLLLSGIFYLTGCNLIYGSWLLGLKTERQLRPGDLSRYEQQFGIPARQSLVLDTSYLRFIRSFPRAALLHGPVKDHAQPLQLLYFDQRGELISFHINCLADPGFPVPNLNWNTANRLNQFPPATAARPDSLLPLPALLRFVRRPDGAAMGPLPPAPLTVVVVWSHAMGRQSKRMLAALRQNLQLARPDQPARVLYVNNDDYMNQLWR